MVLTLFYERRKEMKPAGLMDQRVADRRKQQVPFSPERRRLAFQGRRYQREDFKIPVCFKVLGKEFFGHTQNVSSGGLLVQMDSGVVDAGTVITLQFVFGDGSNLSLSGLVVFSLVCESGESTPNYAIGIRFSAIRDSEQKTLLAAVQKIKKTPAMQDNSLLTIVISESSLSQHSLQRDTSGKEQVQIYNTDKRFSTRIDGSIPLRIFPGDVRGNVFNIGETGICFDSEKSKLSNQSVLKIDLSCVFSDALIEIPVEIIWEKASDNGKSVFGARFSSIRPEQISRIRDFLFENYAKKAASFIKSNEDLKSKIEEYIRHDVRKYHESLSTLVDEISRQTLAVEEIQERVDILTNWILLKADAIERTIGHEPTSKMIKQVMRELIGCWVYKSPVMKMAYDRPRGYPGDYGLFEIIYGGKPISEGLGFFFDSYFLNNPYADAARARKDKMKAILKDFIGKHYSSSVRLLNVACGACREIRDLVSESFSPDKTVVFTGLDHDEAALEYSKSFLNRLPPNFQIRFLKENVLDLIKDEDRYCELLGEQDIIYILGLTEYLPDRIFKKLIRFLFRLVSERGKLVITYKDKDIPFPSIPPEWLCNWSFIKRSQDDLISAVKELGLGNDSIKIEREETGCIFFLTLTKK